jgi:predicted amidophosphoribosyltransferase
MDENLEDRQMIHTTPAGVHVYVLKEYAKRRQFYPANLVRSILLDSIDCIQNLASGLKASCDGYDQHKGSIASWLKEEMPSSFQPRFVVAVPSRRSVSRELAESFAEIYGCTNLSALFRKLNAELRAGEQEVDASSLAGNLVCHEDLECIQPFDSILIVDDVYSTGKSIDAMKQKICRAPGARGLHFVGAAILAVGPIPTLSPSAPAR